MSPFEHGYALVVGVAGLGYYRAPHQLKPLPLSVLNDAVDVARTLWDPEICGYRADRVRLLLEEQATAEGISAGLDWLRECCREEDTAIVFFSGHGWRKERSKESLLVAYDAWTDSPPGGLISGDFLTERFRAIRAGRLAVFLDCCFAGSVGEIKGASDSGSLPYGFRTGLNKDIYEQLGQGEGRAILASSLANEESIVNRNERNSLFTDCLVRGLRGEAGHEGSPTIGIFELAEFVTSQVVRRSGERQRPVMKGEFQDNFPIALRARREKEEASAESPSHLVPKEPATSTSTQIGDKVVRAHKIDTVHM